MAVPANSVSILFLPGGSTTVGEPEYGLAHTVCLRVLSKVRYSRSCRFSQLL